MGYRNNEYQDYNKGYDTYIGVYNSNDYVITEKEIARKHKLLGNTVLFFSSYYIVLRSEKFFIDFEYEEHAAYMYIVVVFTNKETGKQVRNYLHRILAYTFCRYDYVNAVRYYVEEKQIDIKDLDLVVDHKDGNTLNNKPENLRYIMRSINWISSPAYAYTDEILRLKEQCIGPNSDKRWLEIKQ